MTRYGITGGCGEGWDPCNFQAITVGEFLPSEFGDWLLQKPTCRTPTISHVPRPQAKPPERESKRAARGLGRIWVRGVGNEPTSMGISALLASRDLLILAGRTSSEGFRGGSKKATGQLTSSPAAAPLHTFTLAQVPPAGGHLAIESRVKRLGAFLFFSAQPLRICPGA